MSGLEFTGERFIPGTRGEIWIEHWHRYHFAAPWVAGKRVVDVACGEGYGAALLARAGAAEVTGVDVSTAAIAHATRAYEGVPNLRYLQGSCEALPLADGSVDVAVSFETIEHITAQERFLDELARVLSPPGLLLLSCPNKAEYSDRRGYRNEFHVKELYREELAALVAQRFPALAWFRQKPTFYSLIVPEDPADAAALAEVEEADPATAGGELSGALYFLVAASRDPATLAALPRPMHVLADRGDWVHRDYEKVFRMMEHSARECDRLQRELDAARTQAREARDALDALQARASHQVQPARPPGWRGWLARLGLLK